LLADYPQDVKIAYMMHPLPMHSQSQIAAEAAMSANNQGKFMEMHTKLFENMGKLDREKILGFATEIGLDIKKFTADFDGHVTKAEIDRQTQEVMKIGATGTPANFVNGRFLNGAAPYETFKKLVDEELAKANGGKEVKKTD
jgi:protein-disulfide isomerase